MNLEVWRTVVERTTGLDHVPQVQPTPQQSRSSMDAPQRESWKSRQALACVSAATCSTD
jgi:hypothetical protein